MSERHHDHQQDVVGHGVDDAVVPDTHAQSWPSVQRARRQRARVVGQQRNGALDAPADPRIELAQGPDPSRAKLDAVALTPGRDQL